MSVAVSSNLRLNLLQLSPQSPSDPWGANGTLGGRGKGRLAPPPVEPGLARCGQNGQWGVGKFLCQFYAEVLCTDGPLLNAAIS